MRVIYLYIAETSITCFLFGWVKLALRCCFCCRGLGLARSIRLICLPLLCYRRCLEERQDGRKVRDKGVRGLEGCLALRIYTYLNYYTYYIWLVYLLQIRVGFICSRLRIYTTVLCSFLLAFLYIIIYCYFFSYPLTSTNNKQPNSSSISALLCWLLGSN